MITRFIASAVMAIALLAGCTQKTDQKHFSNQTARDLYLEALHSSIPRGTALVTDVDGQPIAYAKILIGSKVGSPFVGNFLQADASGAFATPAEWTTPLNVTIDAPGYVRSTFVGVDPARALYTLNFADGQDNLEVTGEATGFGKLKKDGFVDFSLTIPLVTRDHIIHYGISDLISPENDIISAYGQDIAIPSNASLPDQSENYGLFPIRLNKPTYRSFLREKGKYELVAIHGKFPFKEVIKEFQDGKTLFDVLNKVDFLQAGKTSVEVVLKQTKHDVNVADIKLASATTVTAPKFDPAFNMLSVLFNKNGNLLMPSDIKSHTPGEQVALKGVSGAAQSVLMLLGQSKKTKVQTVTYDEQMSTALMVVSGKGVAPEFLPMIAKPSFNGIEIVAAPPKTVQSVKATGTYMVLQDIEVIDEKNSYYEKRTRLWEVFSTGWTSQVSLPEWPEPVGQSTIKRWYVNYLGTTDQSFNVVWPGPSMVESSTHATKNSIQL